MNAITTQKRGGRPKFKPEYGDQAYHLCLLGATNPNIAKALGVSLSTVEKWIAKKPEFAQRIQEGRMTANAQVAESLFIRARGYSHPDVVVTNYQGQVTLTPITKHYPPDVRACELWLKNRCPELWRDRKPEDAADETQGLIQQAAERIMAADMEEFQRIMDEERGVVSGVGTPQPMSEERKHGLAAKIHRARERRDPICAKDENQNGSESDMPSNSLAPGLACHPLATEILAAAGYGPRATEDRKREFVSMLAISDKWLDAKAGPECPLLQSVVTEAEVTKPKPKAEATPECEPEAPAPDVRALLGLPPRRSEAETRDFLRHLVQAKQERREL